MAETRITRVLNEMKKLGIGELIISDPKSIWYLTGIGFDPYERLFVLIIRSTGHHTMMLNHLFNVKDTGFEEVWYSDTEDYMHLLENQLSSPKVGIDKTWPARFLIPLMQRRTDIQFILGSECVDKCRAVKDTAEIEIMRQASKINDMVMGEAVSHLKEGMSEKELASFIDERYVKHSAEGPCFTTIVSFGANAADPHHEPDDTIVKDSDVVLIDMGCRYNHYCSDMTRTFFFRHADEKYLKIHDIVRQANEMAESQIKPSVVLKTIDSIARDHISSFGYGKNFTHRLGHFIGQDDHEQNDVSSTSEVVAEPGMIFSIEPGIYLPGLFGVRVEDLVLVTETGVEVLNHFDHHPLIIG